MIRRWWIAGVLLIAGVAAFSAIGANSRPASEQILPSPLLYRQAPALQGQSLAGSGPISLASFRGRFVLVNYFASWCTSCAAEMPQLAKLARSGTVAVLGVDYDDQASSARSFLARYGAAYPVIEDPTGQNSVRWGVSAPPESFLVAPDGVVIAKIVGATSLSVVSDLVQLAKSKGY